MATKEEVERYLSGVTMIRFPSKKNPDFRRALVNLLKREFPGDKPLPKKSTLLRYLILKGIEFIERKRKNAAERKPRNSRFKFQAV
jgi:hypothetical protein